MGLVTTLVTSPVSPAVTAEIDAMGSTAYASGFGLLNLCYAAGMMVGPLLGGLGVDSIGLQASLLVMGLAYAGYAWFFAKGEATRCEGRD